MSAKQDDRLFSPAAARNRGPILEVLRKILPADGAVLEVASGSGEHAVFLAPEFPDLVWWPSDPDPEARASIDAWIKARPSPNLRNALALNAGDEIWPLGDGPAISAILCCNMIHIAPWRACLGLLAGAGRILPEGGLLYVYGPFKHGGRHSAPSNQAFDVSLRSRDAAWGVRDLDAVADAALEQGLALEQTIDMPANNLSVIFRAVGPA